jgi:hypothetical protein
VFGFAEKVDGQGEGGGEGERGVRTERGVVVWRFDCVVWLVCSKVIRFVQYPGKRIAEAGEICVVRKGWC